MVHCIEMSLWILVWRLWLTSAIIAYDCQDANFNITTFSLVEIGKCDVPPSQITISNETIQLLQVQDFELIPVIQCKIYVTRMISHCGMHSHMSAVTNGIATYLYPVGRRMCEEMHQRKSVQLYNKLVDNLVINGTTYANVLMAGRMLNENTCQGADYEDNRGRWTNVIVQAALEITLNEHYAVANVVDNRINLPGGTTCPYKELACIDTVYGYSFWDQASKFYCSNTKYNVVYEGLAKRLTPVNFTNNHYESIIYSVDAEDAVFGMPVTRPTTICGQTAFETDHPSFYIVKPSELGSFYFKKEKLNQFNIDPTAYANSKFVFLEKHLRGQLNSLYTAVMVQKCKLEQQVLRNLQTLAIVAPAEFAYAKMNAPGYTAVNYGEVIHVIQCTPVEVTLRYTDSCYHEAPITYNNKSYFMTPRTQIIQKYATEVNCDSFLYPLYQFNNKWYKLAKGLHETVKPQLLSPNNQHTWQYKSPSNLFKGGLYSHEDMESLRRHLILPTERQALTSIVARGMVGIHTDMQGTSLNQLIDEKTVKSWISNSWTRLVDWFMTFGTVTAGFMGIYMVGKIVKFIIDTLIHGAVLYDIFGISLHLLAAFFDSLTMYWVHRNQNSSRNQREPNRQEQETQDQMVKTDDTNADVADQECANESVNLNVQTQAHLYPAVPAPDSKNQNWMN